MNGSIRYMQNAFKPFISLNIGNLSYTKVIMNIKLNLPDKHDHVEVFLVANQHILRKQQHDRATNYLL